MRQICGDRKRLRDPRKPHDYLFAIISFCKLKSTPYHGMLQRPRIIFEVDVSRVSMIEKRIMVLNPADFTYNCLQFRRYAIIKNSSWASNCSFGIWSSRLPVVTVIQNATNQHHQKLKYTISSEAYIKFSSEDNVLKIKFRMIKSWYEVQCVGLKV